MTNVNHTLQANVNIMKSKVTRYAVIGVLISVTALILATLLSSFMQFERIDLETIVEIQKRNPTLWILDAMPFIFAFWGQYVGSIMAYEASSIIFDQTNELRTQTAALEYKAMHDATHDVLTDLPNRVLLRDRLEQAIHLAHRERRKLALCILDLNRFKEINDTLGHYNGDRLLKQVALRLKETVRESDTLARIGGDEFALLLPDIREEKNVLRAMEKIQNAFSLHFVIDGLSLDVQASCGIACYPEHGKDADTIMQRADVAMYIAKHEHRLYTIYSKKLDSHSPQRLTLMGELREGIANDELVLHYQPKIDAGTDRLVGVEALVRWRHPAHGLMAPDQFIPLAERTGLIKELSSWVFRKAFAQANEWHARGETFSMSINLSPSTLLDTEFPDIIAGKLASSAAPAGTFIFEITEGSIIKDPERALEILNRLSNMGIRISIDDFGTGYSSLAYLKKLPVSELKIDKSFVMDMLDNENDEVIVRSTIDLAHNLGLKVVAEGVENVETLKRLKELGCDVLQGYYYSKPMDSEAFAQWHAARDAA